MPHLPAAGGSYGDVTVDILAELLKAVLTLGVIAFVALLMAALFIIVLAIATGIDSNIQPEEDRFT